jgi:hypothetical protein
MSAEAAEAAAANGGKLMNQGAKRQRDFATCYTEMKTSELDFKRQCFEAEREDKRLLREDTRYDKERYREEVKQNQDRERLHQLTMRLLEMGKSMDEIDAIIRRV